MKKWMPLGVVTLIVCIIVGVWASGAVDFTGQARGVKSANSTSLTVTDKAPCPKGKDPKRLRNCPEGTVQECDNDEAPYCCSCEESPPDLSCANVLCTAETTCIEDCDGSPVCVPRVCEGIAGLECPEGFACDADGENPDEGGECEADCDGPTCDTVLCTEGNECVESCDGAATCVPVRCGGVAGVPCPDGFVCDGSDAHPDAQGTCKADCEAECGECKSDDDCKKDEVCTASDDCLPPCDCPQCTVCSGHCELSDD